MRILHDRYRWIIIALAAAVVLGGLIGLWEGGLKKRFIAKRWGVVEPGRIYRSGQISRHVIERTLKKHGIKVVVDLTGPVRDDPDQLAEAAACETLGIDRVRYHLQGRGDGDIYFYAGAIARIHKAVEENEPVLVHCAAGTHRTGGVVAAYRLLVQRKPMDSVLREMRQYGWRPRGNPLLPRYLNSNMTLLAILLVEQGVIDTIPDPLPVVPE